jgi:hypothetical protein
MCFSSAASFTAGVVLTAVGAATLKKVRKPSQRLFASIPLIFGLQQFAEGMVWLSLLNPEYEVLRNGSTYLFLFAAYILWPVLIPASILKMEKNIRRRKQMKAFLFAGIALTLYYATCMLFFKVTPVIDSCHILYVGEFPHQLMIPAFLVYITVTLVPFFLSTMRGMQWMGSLMFLACVISVFFYVEQVTSVWCFFAAAISVVIYRLITVSEKTTDSSEAGAEMLVD